MIAVRYLATALFVVLSVGSVSAQAILVGPRDLLPLPQAMLGELSPVPDGQMRGMIHWHTWRSDGWLSVRSSILLAQQYGAQFLMLSDHAHKLADTSVMLDSYSKIPEQYQVEMGKLPTDAPTYIDEVASNDDIIPSGAWLEVGEESHFLVYLGYGPDLKENATKIVQLGRQTKTLGTQKVIMAIDKILQETGGFMIEAHPMNTRYPFNYNFDGCKSAVGVEFFNGSKSEHWANYRRLLEVQQRSARPVIATAGVDLHFPEEAAGALEGFARKDVIQSLIGWQLEDIHSYRPNQRFTYIFGKSSNLTVIACQIRDGYGYCANGNTVIVDMNPEPGTKFCPPIPTDVSYVKVRGLPDSVKTLKVDFVDDETTEVSEIEAPWIDNHDGTKTASFSVNKLRKYPDHSGKLLMATTEFVTSAVIILGDPQAIAKVIEQEKGTPVIESPAVPAPPVVAQPAQPLPVLTTQPDSPIDPANYPFRFRSKPGEEIQGLLVFGKDCRGRIYVKIAPDADPIDLPVTLDGATGFVRGEAMLKDWSTFATVKCPWTEVKSRLRYFSSGEVYGYPKGVSWIVFSGFVYSDDRIPCCIFGLKRTDPPPPNGGHPDGLEGLTLQFYMYKF